MSNSLDQHYDTLPEGVRAEATVTPLRGRRRAARHPLASLLGTPVSVSRAGFALAVVAANLAAEGLVYLLTK